MGSLRGWWGADEGDESSYAPARPRQRKLCFRQRELIVDPETQLETNHVLCPLAVQRTTPYHRVYPGTLREGAFFLIDQAEGGESVNVLSNEVDVFEIVATSLLSRLARGLPSPFDAQAGRLLEEHLQGVLLLYTGYASNSYSLVCATMGSCPQLDTFRRQLAGCRTAAEVDKLVARVADALARHPAWTSEVMVTVYGAELLEPDD